MASSLGTLKGIVVGAVGNTSDNVYAQTTVGLNYGQRLAAKLYLPPALQAVGSLEAAVEGLSIDLSSLTNLFFILSLYNVTNASDVLLCPFEYWYRMIPNLDGNVKYASRFGSLLYIRPRPLAVNTISVYYLQYPSDMTNDEDTLSFDNYDGFITSFATQYVWMCNEEKDSSDMFNGLISTINSGELLSQEQRKGVEKTLSALKIQEASNG